MHRLRAKESHQGELEGYGPTESDHSIAEQTKEDVTTKSSQLGEDKKQSQLSFELAQKKDLQFLLKQLQSERSDLLTQVEQLSLTESAEVTDNTVHRHSCHQCPVCSLAESERMKCALKSRRSTSPIRQPSGEKYESELTRALEERDEMQRMLDKYERHLSEIQANVRVLTAERDKTRMYYKRAQEELAELRREMLRSKVSQRSKHSTAAQSMLKRLEAERDEARTELHRMSTERDSLRERLKISQETAISERAHLEQKVEDLQNALLTLEGERAEQKGRQEQMKDTVIDLEEKVNTLSRKLAATEGELSCLNNECSMLRLSNSQTENSLSETQKRLINRIEDLQRVQKKNQQLEERNESLLKEIAGLKEELKMLQNMVYELNQHIDTLQEQLKRKNDLICSAKKQLDDKENTINNMNLQTENLKATLEAVEETVSSKDRELDMMRRKLLDLEDELNAALKLKDASLRDNTQLREQMDRVLLDNKALQFKADEANCDIEVLERKVQKYVSDISNIEDLLSSKERECKELQGCRTQLRNSDSDKRRLKEKVEILESSLHEALGAEQNCSTELKQLKSTLEKQDEELREVQSKHLQTQHDLEKTRDLCVKLDTRNEVVQQELESCRSELDLLRKQIATEREKELHRQLISQERLVELQLLKDKLTVADCKANTQNRETAQLRTRLTMLEADLDGTRRQLNTERDERERAVTELRRFGLSSPFSSPILSSTLRTPPSPVRRSLSPHTSYSPERLHHATPDHLLLSRSPNRSVTFRDGYD